MTATSAPALEEPGATFPKTYSLVLVPRLLSDCISHAFQIPFFYFYSVNFVKEGLVINSAIQGLHPTVIYEETAAWGGICSTIVFLFQLSFCKYAFRVSSQTANCSGFLFKLKRHCI